MPVIKKCLICSEAFQTKPYFIKNGGGKYCSLACLHKARKNGKNVSCAVCDKEIYKSAKELKRSKSKKYFCSKSCQTKWRNQLYLGDKHKNWTGGKYAYRSVLKRSGVKAYCRLCNTKDRRVLAVHHIDENRLNNKVENLVYLCHNCHHLVHRYKNEQERFRKMVPIV